MGRTGEATWSFDVTERVITPGNFLFGGCGLASALVALEEASARPTIWATAQYLSYAPLGATVTVETDLAVVGGHVTQARATTFAEGREILTVNGAFGTGELSATTPWVTMPVVKPPEECPERIMPERFNRSIFNHLEARIALGRPFEQIDGTPGSPVSALWSRVPGHFELSAATLAIFGTTSRADFLSRSAFPRWAAASTTRFASSRSSRPIGYSPRFTCTRSPVASPKVRRSCGASREHCSRRPVNRSRLVRGTCRLSRFNSTVG